MVIENKVKRVLIIGECYSDNIGDQAISAGMEKCFRRNGWSVDIADFSFRSETFSPEHFYKNEQSVNFDFKKLVPSWIRLIFFIQKALRGSFHALKKGNYELIVIGGGQLILSNATFPLSMFFLSFFIKKNKMKACIVSVGVGEKISGIRYLLFRYALQNINCIYVRDKASVDNLERLYGIEAKYCPDIAYYLARGIERKRQKGSNKRVIIGCIAHNVHIRYSEEVGRRPLSENEYFDEWIRITEAELAKGKDVNLVVTSIEDLVLSRDLYKKLRYSNGHIKITDYVPSWEEYIQFAMGTEKVISGRMHALILAKIAGAKTEAYIVSKKIEDMLEITIKSLLVRY